MIEYKYYINSRVRKDIYIILSIIGPLFFICTYNGLIGFSIMIFIQIIIVTYFIITVSDKSVQLIINESGITTKNDGLVKWKKIYLAELDLGLVGSKGGKWNLIVKNENFETVLIQDLTQLSTPHKIEKNLDEVWFKVKGEKRLTYNKYPTIKNWSK